MDSLISVDEAARRLGGLSKYTIHAWLAKGKLRRTKVGSRTMIRESELARVIEDDGKSPGRPHPEQASADRQAAPGAASPGTRLVVR